MKQPITWDQYKIEAHKFAQYNSPDYVYIGLIAETHEYLAKAYSIYAKILRGDFVDAEKIAKWKKELYAEAGDVAWFTAEIGKSQDFWLEYIYEDLKLTVVDCLTKLGIFPLDIPTILAGNIEKLEKRFSNNTIKGDGDNR